VHRRATEAVGIDFETAQDENQRRLQIFPVEGLSFERELKVYDGEEFKVDLNDDKCEIYDAQGHNKCRYDWGEDIEVVLTDRRFQELDSDVSIEFGLKISTWYIPIFDESITLDSVCGVTLEIPLPDLIAALLPWDAIPIALPPCPLVIDRNWVLGLTIPNLGSNPFVLLTDFNLNVNIARENEGVIASADIKARFY